jgi:hypothetical protein
MAVMFQGQITQVKEEGDEVIVFCTLQRKNFKVHNAQLTLEKNSKFYKKFTDEAKDEKNKRKIFPDSKVILSFGFTLFGRCDFFGRVESSVAKTEDKKDSVVVKVLQSPLLIVKFEDNVMLEDKYLEKYLKARNGVYLTFV